MEFIFLIIVGVIVFLIVKSKKKKKQEEAKASAILEDNELFKKFVTQAVEEFENRDSDFLVFYESSLEGFDIEKAKLDAIYEDIPFAKERFANSCRELAKIGKTNICLMEKENLDWSQRTNERITNDIIQVLPLLANFYKEYNYLYKYICDDLLLYGVTLGANECTFGCFFGDEADEGKAKIREHTLNVINEWFDLEINTMIRVFLELDKSVDIRNSNNPKIVHYLNIAEKMKKESLLDKFIDIWIMQMRKIGVKYPTTGKELMAFFDEIENEIKADLPWFSMAYVSLPSYNLLLKEQTEEECLRVLELYISGKMTGAYSEFNEKMSLKNN